MRKFLCVLLSLIMMLSAFSVLSVVSFAADDEASSSAGEGAEAYTLVSFEPADEYESYYSPYQYTGGEWEYCKNEETGLWSYEYKYDFYNIFLEGNKLGFLDSEGYPVEFVYKNGKFSNENGDVLDGELLDTAPGKKGSKQFIKIAYGDSVIQHPITFADSKIEMIDAVTLGELSAYIDGKYAIIPYGENAGEIGFLYNALYSGMSSFTVTYQDGTKEQFTYSADEGNFVNDKGQALSSDVFSYTQSQSYEEWLPGGNYEVLCYYKGEPFSMPYQVSENPVKAVEYIQAEIPQYKENLDGDKRSCEIEGCTDCQGEYFNYTIGQSFPVQGDKIKITLADDTTTEYVLKGRYYVDENNNRLPSQCMVRHNNQNKNHWDLGENKFVVEVYGYEVELTANVSENGITSVQFAPIDVYENNFGEWDTEKDAYIYNKPHLINGSNFTVSYTDGSSKIYYYNKVIESFISADDEIFEFDIKALTEEQYNKPWQVGKNILPLEIGDFLTSIEVNVIENPVESISFVPAQKYCFEFEKDGEWQESVNSATGETTSTFYYDISGCKPYTDGNKLIVQLKGNEKIVYTYNKQSGKFLTEDGKELPVEYDVEFVDMQCTAPWSLEAPENNYIGVTYMGCSGKIGVLLDNGKAPQSPVIKEIKSGEGYVKISWSQIANAEEYKIWRTPVDKNGVAVGDVEYVDTTTECYYVDSVDTSAPIYYLYNVTAHNSYGQLEYDADKDAFACFVPTVKGLTISQNKKGVAIKWTAFDGQLKLYRRAGGETKWTYLATLDGKKNSVFDTKAQSGKYYKYRAERIDGVNKSALVDSNLIMFMATPKLSKIQNADSGIYVSWTKSEGAAGYRVYRRGEGEKTYTLLTTTSNLWYCDTSVKENIGKYYKYTIRAVNGKYISDYEDGLVLQRNLVPKLTSVANTNNGVVVKWNKLNKATEYQIYRRGAGQTTWTYLGTTKNLQFLDKGVKNYGGNYYRYTVRAMFGKIKGTFDTNGLVILRLAAPQITRVKNDANGVKIEFNAVKGATGYYVYHKVGKSSWVRLGSTTKTSFVDMDVKAGTSYTYTVKAYKGSYMSDYVATTTPLIHVPAPALNTPVNTENGIKITWQAVSMAETYYVGRRDVNGTWKTIKTIKKSEVKKDSYGQIYYVDTTAVEGKTYNYSVRAYAKGTSSGYTENRFGTFLPPVDVLSAKNVDGGIKITWEKSPKATGYVIWRKASDGSRVEAINVKNATSYVDKNVTKGVKYTYTVWAIGGPEGTQSESVAGASKSCTAK